MKEILILTLEQKCNNVKTEIYRKTLKYIADNLANAEVYQFINNKELIKFIRAHKFFSVIYTNEILCETAFLMKGLGLVQIVIGVHEDLEDICDIIIDPLVSKSEKYLVGTRYLLSSIVNQVSKEELSEIIEVEKNILIEEVSHNEAETELIDIVQLYQKLAWDSDFFGMNIGYISCLRLTPNIEKHIKKFIRKEKIDLLEYLCNCHDRESVVTSEKNGYSFVDIRLTFEKFLHNNKIIKGHDNYNVSKGEAGDVEEIKKIATDIYKYSRYYFDDNFDREKVINFYVNWVEKAIYGQFDDYVYVLYDKNKPIGFCTVKKTRRNTAKIGLFGISSEYGGKGLGEYLLDISLEKLKQEENINYVEVVTQGRNYAAQRLYQKCGFVTKTTELWYHKWFR